MKQSVLSILLCLALLLSGCSHVPEPAQAVTEITLPDPSQMNSQTTDPQEPAQIAVLESGSFSALAGSPDLCAALAELPDSSGMLYTFNPKDGSQLGSVELPSPYVDLIVFPNGTALWDWSSQTLSVYSPDLIDSWQHVLSPEENGILHPDGWFYICSGDNTITRLSLKDQSSQTRILPQGDKCSDVILSTGTKSLLSCESGPDGPFYKVWLNWDTGETTEALSISDNSPLSRNHQLDVYTGEKTLYLRQPESDRVQIVPGSYPWVISSDASFLLTEEDQCLLSLYLLNDGTVTQCSTSGVFDAVVCGSSVVYLQYGDQQTLYLWDTSLSQIRENVVHTITLSDLESENDAIASSLTEQTSMGIYYGEGGTEYNGSEGTSYTSLAETDPVIIRLALEQLQHLINQYPDGIFQEMATPIFNPVEVYLSGPISGSGEDSSLSSPAGFTCYNGQAQVLVLPIGRGLEPLAFRATIAHEFMHIMENRINLHGLETGLDYLSYWDSFIPHPDLYFYAYHDSDGFEISDSEFTAHSDSPKEEVLFLDPYSRTLPTEDRARILENLYLGEDSSYADYLSTGILRQKAEYLCSVIRECFPSCRDAAHLPWEVLIQPVPFSQFEANVRDYVPTAVG